MAAQQAVLPQLGDAVFLMDGGLETTLVFLEGVDLPQFAAFPLLDEAQGRARLERYFAPYLEMAAERGLGFVLDTATWRANRDWGAKLGYRRDDLIRVNRDAVAFARRLAAPHEGKAGPIVINGVVGPRGDGYRPDALMSPEEAEIYHLEQVDTFTEAGADMVSALTMNYVAEAIGIARAAVASGIPSVISFTVETDGLLPSGGTLEEAVRAVDEATDGAPAYYMINCAHPTHFEAVLSEQGGWMARVRGVRANASTKSHAELDAATELDPGDPADLARRYRSLRDRHAQMTVLGGCCGTDYRHIRAICEACV